MFQCAAIWANFYSLLMSWQTLGPEFDPDRPFLWSPKIEAGRDGETLRSQHISISGVLGVSFQ